VRARAFGVFNGAPRATLKANLLFEHNYYALCACVHRTRAIERADRSKGRRIISMTSVLKLQFRVIVTFSPQTRLRINTSANIYYHQIIIIIIIIIVVWFRNSLFWTCVCVYVYVRYYRVSTDCSFIINCLKYTNYKQIYRPRGLRRRNPARFLLERRVIRSNKTETRSNSKRSCAAKTILF